MSHSVSLPTVFNYWLLNTQIVSRIRAKLVVSHFISLAQIYCPSGARRIPGGTLVHVPRLLPSFACPLLFSGLPAFSPSTLSFFPPVTTPRAHAGVMHSCCLSRGSENSWPDLDLPAAMFGARLFTLDNQGRTFKSSTIWGVRHFFFFP